MRYVTFIALGLFVPVSSIQAEEHNPPLPPAVGYLREGMVFCLGEDDLRSLVIQQQPFVDFIEQKKNTIDYHFHWMPVNPRKYRWRIECGCFWACIAKVDRISLRPTRVPINEFDVYNLALPGEERVKLNKKYKRGPFSYQWQFDPATDLADVMTGKADIQFDFVPVGSEVIQLFILQGATITVWEGKGTYFQLEDQGYWEFAWKKLFALAAPFKDAFFVRLIGDDYYFIPEAERSVYRATAKSKQLEPLWDPKELPIIGLVNDLNGEKIYLFARATKDEARELPQDKRHCYFELGRQVQPRYYDPATLRLRPADAVNQATQLRHFLRVLVADGKLKRP